MFETLVSNLLQRYLGEYIQSLNTENLNISILKGNVSLENLQLKKRALEKFNLPFTIKEGFLGKLSLKIPWNNLKTEPVIIIIDNLYITASPKSATTWDKEDEELLFQKKIKKLKVYEALKEEKRKKIIEQKEKREKRKQMLREQRRQKQQQKFEKKKQQQRLLIKNRNLKNNNNNEINSFNDDNDQDENNNNINNNINDQDNDENNSSANNSSNIISTLEDDSTYSINKNEFGSENGLDTDDTNLDLDDEDYDYGEEDDEEEEEEEEEDSNEDYDDQLIQDEIYKGVLKDNFEEENENQSNSSFTDKLRNKIVDNLQIMIYNVHVRFEDTITNPSTPYCFGITLEHLLASSCNEEWKPKFIHISHSLVHKLINLQNLSVYWDAHTNDPNLNYKNINDFKNLMTQLIPKKSNDNSINPNHNYLLHPVCGSLKLLINKSIIPNKFIPLYTANFEFDEINLEIESKQYSGILALVDWFSILKKGEKYRKFKPKGCGGILKTPSERWSFALACIKSEVQDRLLKWTPKYFEKRRKDRLEYIHLYKLKKRKKNITDLNSTRFDQLEREYSFEDLVYFRSIGDAQIKAEDSVRSNQNSPPILLSPKSNSINNNSNNNQLDDNSNNDDDGNNSNNDSNKTTPTKKIEIIDNSNSSNNHNRQKANESKNINNDSNNSTSGSNKGWFRWLWGGSGSKKQEDAIDQETILSTLDLTDQQKRELYSTIEYDEHQVSKNIVYPKDYVKTRINFKMNRGSVSFKLQPPTTSITHFSNSTLKSKSSADLVIELVGMSISLDKFVESLYVQAMLQTIFVRDYFTENTQFPILMKPILNNNNNDSGNNGNANYLSINSSPILKNNKLRSSNSSNKIITPPNNNNDDDDKISLNGSNNSNSNNCCEDNNENNDGNQNQLEQEQQEELSDEEFLKQPLFSMTLQQNPLNSESDFSIFIEALPLEIIYNKSMMDSILEFFGNAPSDTLKEIEEAARNQIKIFKDKTTLRIQYELQNHKSVDLDININAPHVLIPESFITPSSPILVLDLGSFSLQSVITHKASDETTSEEIEASSILKNDLSVYSSGNKSSENNLDSTTINSDNNENNQDSTTSSPQLNQQQQQQQSINNSIGSNSDNNIYDDENVTKYLYESFELKLNNIQFYLVSSGELIQLVEKFNINFKIFKCIIKAQTLLSKLKLFGDLPTLNILLSQKSIEIMIKIISTLQNDPPEISSHLISSESNNNDQLLNNNNGNINISKNEDTEDLIIGINNKSATSSNTTTTALLEDTDEKSNILNTSTLIHSMELENPNDQLPILMIHHTILEVSFSIPTVSLEVREDIQSKPFFKLLLSDINAQVLKRTFDTTVNLSLKKLYIEDLYQDFENENFKYLAKSLNESNIFQDGIEESLEDHLININILSVQRNSPEYSGTSQKIDVFFNTLFVNINKKLVIKIINMVEIIEKTIVETVIQRREKRNQRKKDQKQELENDTNEKENQFLNQSQQGDKSNQQKEESQDELKQFNEQKEKLEEEFSKEEKESKYQQQSKQKHSRVSKSKKKKKKEEDNPMVIITTKMKSLIVNLNEDDQSYFMFQVSDLSINFDIDLESSMVRFKLGNLEISDISKDASKDLNPLFGTDGEHIIEFYVLTYKNIKIPQIVENNERKQRDGFGDDNYHNDQERGEGNGFERQEETKEVEDEYQYDKNGQVIDFNSKIGVRMSSVKLIVIISLIERIIDYFDDFITSQLDHIITESAKGAVEIMATRHTNQQKRVLFEIDVDTPRIIFPKNNSSQYVIIADLGHISVFNKYNTINTISPSEQIFIYASSVNFHSCKFLNGKVVDSTIEAISNKINVHVNIESFITFSIEQNEAKQKVDGEISPIHLKISDQQYILIIAIIKSLIEPNIKQKKRKKRDHRRMESQVKLDNLYQSFINVAQSNQSHGIDMNHNNIIASLPIPTSLPIVTPHSQSSEPSNNNNGNKRSLSDIKDQISFHLPHVSLEFFKKNKESVVSLEVIEFECSVIEYENGNEYSNFSIGSIDLTDTRKSNINHFRKIIHHFKPLNNNNNKKEIQVYMCDKRNGDTEVKVLLDNFRGIIVPESLISMIDFIMPGIKALSSLSEISPISSPVLDSEAIKNNPIFSNVDQNKSIPAVKSILEQKNKKTIGQTTIVHIETTNLELSLVDNSSSRESRLLTLKGSLFGKINIQVCEPLTYKDFQISIENLELFKCRANNFDQTAESIIDPFTMTSSISLVEGKDYLPIDILIGVNPINLSISYQDLLLFLSISKNFNLLLNNFNKLLNNGSNGKVNQNQLQNQQKEEKEISENKKEILRINFQSPSIELTIINDHNNKYFGVLNFKFNNISVEVSQSRIMVGLFLSSNYFNISKSVWEPVIEEWGCKLGIETSKTPINQINNIVLTTNQNLNLNITKSLFDTIISSCPIFISAFESSNQLDSNISFNYNNNLSQHYKSQNYHPFLLKNQTGLEIEYSVIKLYNPQHQHNNNNNNFKILNNLILENGSEIYLDLRDMVNLPNKNEKDRFKSINNTQKYRDTTSISLFRVNITVKGFETITSLPIHKTGIYICNLIPKQHHLNHNGSGISSTTSNYELIHPEKQLQQLVFEIKASESSKILLVRSNVLVVNETDHAIEFLDRPAHSFLGSPFILEPKQSKPMSLSINQSSPSMILSFRPLLDNNEHLQQQQQQHNFQRWTPPLDCSDNKLHPGTLLFDCPPNKYYFLKIDQHLSNYQFDEPISQQQQQQHNLNQQPLSHQNNQPYHHINNRQYQEFKNESSFEDRRSNHIIKIVAPLVIINYFIIPIDVSFYDQESNSIVGKERIENGKRKDIYCTNIEKVIMIKVHMEGYGWSEYIQINQSSPNNINKQPRKIISTLNGKPFYLNVHQNEFFGSIQVSLYSSFSIINNTGLSIQYKLNNVNIIGNNKLNNLSATSSSSSPTTTTTTTTTTTSTPSIIKDSIEKYQETVNIYTDPRNWYNDNNVICSMFSPISAHSINTQQLLLQVDNSNWSSPISIQLNKFEQVTIIKEQKSTLERILLQYSLYTQIESGSLTKTITISPQYILINNLSSNLYYSQKDSSLYKNFFIKPNETLPFHFLDEHLPKKITFRLSDKIEWSGSFNINKTISFNIQLEKPSQHFSSSSSSSSDNSDNDNDNGNGSDSESDNDINESYEELIIDNDNEFYLPMIQILQEKGIYYVIINPETKDYPPYIIQNLISLPISIHQVDTNDQTTFIYSNHSKRYTWSNPMGTKRLEITIPNTNYKKNVSLDKLQYHQPFPVKYLVSSNTKSKDLNIKLEILANGPTNILRMIDLNDIKSINRKEKLINSNNNGGQKSKIQQEKESKINNFEFYIGSINVSIIDSIPKELLFITLKGLQVRFKEFGTEQNISISIHSFKVDNQLYHTPYPVMISSFNSNTNSPTNHSLILNFIRSSQYQPKELHQIGIEYIKELRFDIQPFEVQIDEVLLFHLFNFINLIKLSLNNLNNNNSSKNHQTNQNNDNLKIDKIKLPYSNIPLPTTINSKRLYIELLYLPLVDINLSYRSSPHNRPMIGPWASSAFSALANIDNAQLHLESWKLEHQFVTADALGLSLFYHYKWEVSKILLYSGFLGAPLTLAENITRGINDLINESSAGFTNPEGNFTKGVVKGTKSLVSNSLYGIFNSASKLTNTIGTAIAPFSMDENYLQQRDNSYRHSQQPKHVLDGVSNGLEKLSQGIANGLSGLVDQPVKEFQDQGFTGLVKGLGKGLIGTFVKPTVGAIDMINSASQGLRNTYLDPSSCKSRSRPPRFIGSDGIIKSFSFEKSFWQELIKVSIKPSLLSSKEWYITNFKVYDDKRVPSYLVISTINFYLFTSKFNLLLMIKLWDLQLSLKRDDKYLEIQELVKDYSYSPKNPKYLLLLDKNGKSISYSLLNSIQNTISSIKMDQTYFIS